MKNILLFLISICMLASSLSVPVMAEDVNVDVLIEESATEDVALEETITEENISEDDLIENIPDKEEIDSDHITTNEHDFTSFTPVQYARSTNLFSVRYSDEEKSFMLRDFLDERLSNMEQYQDELSLGEYRFPGDSTTSDLIFIDLSELPGFELLANSSNKASTKEIIATAINEIQNKYPNLFWVKNAYYWEYNLSDYKVTKIGLKLNCGTNFDINDGLQPVIDEVNFLTAKFNGYVKSIVELVPDNYSDYKKVLFVNDYLCTNYKYDVDYKSQNPYDFFITGTGVCQGYALAFMAIMDELGIDCDTVVSEDMNHIWNIVELNGKWYHIDVTWNDPYWENCDTDTLGLAQHKYFLLSSECMQDSDHEHYDFDTESYETGTKFDEIEVDLNQSLRSSFIELYGAWYNTGYSAQARTCGLYAFNSPDLSSITNEDLKTPLYNIGLWGYVGSFSYLSKYKDTILFNTPTSICVFDGSNVAELYVPDKANNEKIYGFDMKGDTIRIQLATNPNEDGMKNAVLKTASLVDVVYKDYDGTILSEGFAVEGSEIPELFIPDTPVRSPEGYYEYTFDKWVTDDSVTFIAAYTKTLKEGITLPVQEGITVSSIPNDKVYGDPGFKIDVNTTAETLDLGDFEFSIVDQDGNKIDNPTVATIDIDGTVTINAAGTTYIKISRNGGTDYTDFEQTETLIVAPKEILITPTSNLSKYEGLEDIELTYTFEEDELVNADKDIITGTLSRVAGEEPGVYNITLGTLKINDNYNLVLPETAVVFEIKAKLNQDVTVIEIDTPNVHYGDTLTLTVKHADPDVINEFVFASNNEEIATIDNESNIAFVGVGEVTITISIAGDYKYNPYKKVFIFNVLKREIILSAIDFNTKKAVFTNCLEADTNINLDFNKARFEVIGACEEDSTKSNVKATNLVLTGEKAEYYTLTTKQFDCVVANTNIIDVNPKAENGTISGIGKYLANVEVTLTATANSKYKFDGWYKNDTRISTNATYTFNTSELEGVEAKFSKKPAGGGGGGGGDTEPSTYTVKFETNDVNLTIEKVTVESGQCVKAPEVPVRDGFKFDGWYTDKALTEKYDFNTEVKKSFTLYAKWVEEAKEIEDPEEITPATWSNPFTDVDTEAWYYDDVKNIIEKKLMTGIADNTFSPDEATTRGMIVTILYRLEGEPITDANNIFDDVSNTDYYSKAVVWASTNGIVSGVGEGKFAPNDEITREQFAAILYRYANFKGLDVTVKADLDKFSDNEEISTWATDAIAWANANGIITGTSAITISPQNGAVRAQTAAMLNRFISLLKIS